MPYGYAPPGQLPPPPEELPISPYARRAGQTPSLSPPPIPQLSGPNPMADLGNEDRFKDRLLRALPTLGAGLLGAIGGPNSALGQFGAGGAMTGSKLLLDQTLQQRRKEAEQEENLIKNVHGHMEKIRRLGGDPRFQEIIGQYDQAMMDGKLTGKEAARLHQQAMGLGDIERSLKDVENQDALEQFQKRAEIEEKLKRAGNVNQMIGGQQVSLTPDQYADYTIGKERIASSESLADKRAATAEANAQRRFDKETARDIARQDREDRKQRGIEDRFGSRQDLQFQTKMDHWFGAQEALQSIDQSLDRFQNTSMFHPIDLGLAGQELDSTIKSLSTLIGRNLGERGVFTDADRTVFSSIITPGLVISKLSPDEAARRLNQLKDLMSRVKSRELGAYAAINPGSKLLQYYKDTKADGESHTTGTTGLPDASQKPPNMLRPPPAAGGLPEGHKMINGVEYEKRDGPEGRGYYKVKKAN